MDEATLLGIIEAEETALDDTELDAERDRALDYYYGRAVGNLAPPAIPNRSSYVSRDVSDTVDWIMPALMKTFLAGDEIVTFSPRGPEDMQAAEQETDYINHIVADQNPIYEIFSTWFDDALVQKNGYTYSYWKTEQDIDEEKYTGLMLDQVTMLSEDPDVKITEANAQPVGVDETGQPIMVYDVTLSRTNEKGRICIENIPPELSRVSWRHRGVRLQDAPFAGFDAYMSISELREMGHDVDDDISDTVTNDNDETSLVYRDRFSLSRNRQQLENDDPAGRVVRVRYRWMRVDFDGDGIAELRYLMLVGQEILTNEKTDVIPIACITPRIVAHNHVGRSVEEVVSDLQELKTQFIRGLIDNTHLANNGRYAVDVSGGKVNLDDMMVSRPGGVVRVNGDPSGAILPLQHHMLGQPAMAAVEMIDGIRETRTGVTKYNMGTDAGNLNDTATGIKIISNAANQRIEWIARTFAETGVKELFQIVHALTRKHQDQPAVVRLRNKWVTVDPRDWKKRNDLSISVGLGSVNRETQSAGIMQIARFQKEAFQAGIVSPENVYNTGAEFVKGLGFKDPDKFFTMPDKMPQKPQQTDPRIEKIKADMANAEKDRELEREKLGLEKEAQDFDQQVQVGTMAGQAIGSVLPQLVGIL